jgi:hypothetical protein
MLGSDLVRARAEPAVRAESTVIQAQESQLSETPVRGCFHIEGELMSKKMGSTKTCIRVRTSRSRRVIVISLVLTLLGVGGVLARWSGNAVLDRQPDEKNLGQVAPQSFTPGSPSKEYIYAGGKLVATEEPITGGCTFSLSPTNSAFSSSGGTGTVNVTAGAGCAWTAISNNSFITITSGSSGTGNGSVGYSVAINTGGARNGTMTIAGQSFTVSQAAAGCSYSISPTSQNFIAAGGAGTVNVTAGVGCGWTATSNAAWITITGGGSGSGNGSVSYSVAANTGSARSGSMTIASQTFTVTQDGASCTYFISPTSASFPASGGAGSTNVTAGAGCQWTATSNNSWITITSGSSGSGNGAVNYSVAVNTGTARTGTITIAGQTFTVNQSASGAPPAPTNLTATALTSTSIRLNWSFVEDGISFFKIERKLGTGGTYSQIASTNQGDRTFTNTKLTTHTTYCYRIRAFNGQDSPYSNEACATTP